MVVGISPLVDFAFKLVPGNPEDYRDHDSLPQLNSCGPAEDHSGKISEPVSGPGTG